MWLSSQSSGSSRRALTALRPLAAVALGFGLAAPVMLVMRANMAVGDATAFLEVVTALGPETPVGKFLAERGEGIFLISLAVNDMDAAVSRLRDAGARVGDPAGQPGNRLAFVSPRNTNGVSIQLRERLATSG